MAQRKSDYYTQVSSLIVLIVTHPAQAMSSQQGEAVCAEMKTLLKQVGLRNKSFALTVGRVKEGKTVEIFAIKSQLKSVILAREFHVSLDGLSI